jgi:phenylpyruvate tautomerase PptA (4-oxalocrotonate tautomerase family)
MILYALESPKEAKAAIAAAVTTLIGTALEVPDTRVHVIFFDIPGSMWSFAGRLVE